MYFAIIEHGEGEGDALAEAFVIYVVNVLVECVNLIIEGVGIGTANDAAVFELTLEDFNSCADKLTLFIEADF